MRCLNLVIVAPLLLLAAAPAAATYTVNATATNLMSAQAGRYNYAPLGIAPSSAIGTTRGNLQLNNSTYPHAFLGGANLGAFVAFCIEPLQPIAFNVATDFNVVQLPRAASGMGGIGTAKAELIRELFGRFAPAGGHGTMTSQTSAAFQLAIWEIVMEAPGNPLNINSATTGAGDWTMVNGANVNNQFSFNLAQSWLGQLDGTGPKARGLVVLQNGLLGQSSGAQDLLAFAGVPEPSSWAMLIAGFGLTGAALRRRRAAIARAI